MEEKEDEEEEEELDGVLIMLSFLSVPRFNTVEEDEEEEEEGAEEEGEDGDLRLDAGFSFSIR